tara:strand:+ start:481 stop:843 length:363 start_codon:yes stop_codon:yes gene_type:complete
MKSKILVSCVSILAIIFVSLMPVISQAFEKNQSIDYQVICSSNGLKVITSENLNQNDINKCSINHCSYCSFAVDDDSLEIQVNSSKNFFLSTNNNSIIFSSIISKDFSLSTNPSQGPPSI